MGLPFGGRLISGMIVTAKCIGDAGSNEIDPVFNWVRSTYWSMKLRLLGARVGRNLRVCGRLEVLLRDGARWRNVRIGHNVTLGGKTYLRLRRNGRISLGDEVSTGTEVWLVGANDAELSVGDHTTLGSYCVLNGGHGLKIGNDCILAAFVYINSSDHASARAELIRTQRFVGAPIDIGDDVWLGGHVFVGKGVTVGRGSVIGAGAVVVKDIPEYKVAVGNPAKVLKDRE